jgi:hypothetical protein
VLEMLLHKSSNTILFFLWLFTRERERERERLLLNEIPGLKAHTKGRDLLLIFEKDIGSIIALACG